jgi:hypothetical protein
MREALAEALPHEDWCFELDRHPEYPCPCASARWSRVEELPAVVRRIVAEELISIGAAQLAKTPGPHPVAVPVSVLFDRAEAIDPTTTA